MKINRKIDKKIGDNNGVIEKKKKKLGEIWCDLVLSYPQPSFAILWNMDSERRLGKCMKASHFFELQTAVLLVGISFHPILDYLNAIQLYTCTWNKKPGVVQSQSYIS